MRVFPKLASAAGANKRNPAPISQNKICYTEAVLDKNSRTVNKLNVREIGAGFNIRRPHNAVQSDGFCGRILKRKVPTYADTGG